MTPAQKDELRRGTKARLENNVNLALLLFRHHWQWRRDMRARPIPTMTVNTDIFVRRAIKELRVARYALEAAQPDHRNERALQVFESTCDICGSNSPHADNCPENPQNLRLEPPDCLLCGDTGEVRGAEWSADDDERFPCPNGCKERLQNKRRWEQDQQLRNRQFSRDNNPAWAKVTEHTAVLFDGEMTTWGDLSGNERQMCDFDENGQLVGGMAF